MSSIASAPEAPPTGQAPGGTVQSQPDGDRIGPVAAGTVALAVLLIVLAVPASGRLAAHGLSRALATVAVSFAVAAAVAGLGATLLLLLRRTTAAVRLTVASAVLVISAVVAAGASVVALLVVAQPGSSDVTRSGLSVQYNTQTGEGARLTMHADLTSVAAGGLVRAEISAEQEGSERLILAQTVTTARATGTVSLDLAATVPDGVPYSTLRILAEAPERRCMTSIRPEISETPTVSCKDR
jgi:hypothetical protein